MFHSEISNPNPAIPIEVYIEELRALRKGEDNFISHFNIFKNFDKSILITLSNSGVKTYIQMWLIKNDPYNIVSFKTRHTVVRKRKFTHLE